MLFGAIAVALWFLITQPLGNNWLAIVLDVLCGVTITVVLCVLSWECVSFNIS